MLWFNITILSNHQPIFLLNTGSLRISSIYKYKIKLNYQWAIKHTLNKNSLRANITLT